MDGVPFHQIRAMTVKMSEIRFRLELGPAPR